MEWYSPTQWIKQPSLEMLYATSFITRWFHPICVNDDGEVVLTDETQLTKDEKWDAMMNSKVLNAIFGTVEVDVLCRISMCEKLQRMLGKYLKRPLSLCIAINLTVGC